MFMQVNVTTQSTTVTMRTVTAYGLVLLCE